MATRLPASQRTREELTALMKVRYFHSFSKGANWLSWRRG